MTLRIAKADTGPRLKLEICHDYIDAERNGTKFKSACGKWIRAETISEQQDAKVDVNCEACLAIRAYYEGMSFDEDEAS